MIYIGIAVSLALFAAQAIYCFAICNLLLWRLLFTIIAQPGAGVSLLILIFIFALYLFWVRSRIPFAIEMISTAATLVQAYPGIQVTAYVSLFVQVFILFFTHSFF